MDIETPNTPSGGDIPAAVGPEPGPANPNRAELNSWYDSPSAVEISAGKLEAEAPAAPGSDAAREPAEPTDRSQSLMSEAPQIQYRNYADYAPPENFQNVKLDRTAMTELHQLLDRSIGSHAPLDHNGLRNELLNRHVAEVQRVADDMARHQRKVWDDTQVQWKNQAREQFGNTLDTALARGKAMIQEIAGDRAARIFSYLDYAGGGNNPDIIWLFDQLGQRFNVFEDGMVRSNPGSSPAAGKSQRGWYGNSGR